MAPKTCSKKIKRSKFLKPRISNGVVSSKEWLKHITDESSKAVIPVGPRFQADVRDWNGQIPGNYQDESKWLGAKVWQPNFTILTAVEEDGYTSGKGKLEPLNEQSYMSGIRIIS
ncbi:hypothetical protein DCAR_0206640 [Daucus carota subsp. sativus]|uniref:Uncharacterized protein n=1 Tax=Daucus carota subsp. sativus TaxID=79200 RepID=A0A161Y6N8_DAUCS|nr:hypothetical protein DCAR_0206640 [Daucus carota subsp. sativus]